MISWRNPILRSLSDEVSLYGAESFVKVNEQLVKSHQRLLDYDTKCICLFGTVVIKPLHFESKPDSRSLLRLFCLEVPKEFA